MSLAIVTAEVDALAARRAAGEAGGRATIEIKAGELDRIVDEAQAALIRADAGIYQRGGQLVRIATLEGDSKQHGVSRGEGSTVIVPVSRDFLALPLARAATWRRWDSRRKSKVAVDPPAAVARALVAAIGEWKFPSLAGVVSAPTLRADGSLLDRPGYDAASRLYATFAANEFPPIPAQPTREDALEALRRFDDVFMECEFAGGTNSPHASVMRAACITGCVRQALRDAPATGISARKPGSGKTTTAKVVALLTMGRDPPVVAPTDDENEFKKALLAILIAGDPVVLVDNAKRPVDSAALCAALTSSTYSDRVLGVSQTVTVPTTCTWLVTGNALEFVGDLTTRALLSVLDPQCEQPESRDFQRDLTEYVLEHRGELVRAALTIPLAYRAAGSPAVAAARSRFADWDQLVRFPLLWLGAADPLETQSELRATDPVREALVALLHAWITAFGEAPTSVADAVAFANLPVAREGDDPRAQLHEALLMVGGERNGAINTRRVGRYLVRNLRRIEGGVRFEAAGEDVAHNVRRYRVTRVSEVSVIPPRASVR